MIVDRCGRTRRAHAFVVLAFLVWASPVFAQEELTLEVAMKRSLQTHERAKIAELDVEAAEGAVESARADFLPTLVLGAEATLAPPDDADRYVTGSGTLTLRQPLLNPSAIPRLSSAKHTLESEKLSAGEERRQLAFETARAFLDALAAERFVDAAEERLKRAKANQDNAQARVDAELNSSNDVTRAKLEVSSAARELAQRERDEIEARIALALLVGGPVEGELVSPEVLFEEARTFAGNAEELSNAASTTRGDVRALEEQALAAKESAKEPLFRLAPSIDLTGRFRVNPDPLPEQSWHDESLTLALTWTIFDGGQRYGDRKTLLARTYSIDAQRSLVRRTLSTEIQSSITSLETSRTTYSLAQEAKSAATTNTEETNVLYQQGLARAIEVVDANAEQFDAEVEVESSRIEMARSYLGLRQSMGAQPLAGFEAEQ
ncbi:MAG: TolC family protein [Polyangiaceae bacterium]|nr:TolC family protein [Polyangiaceae bacterium]